MAESEMFQIGDTVRSRSHLHRHTHSYCVKLVELTPLDSATERHSAAFRLWPKQLLAVGFLRVA